MAGIKEIIKDLLISLKADRDREKNIYVSEDDKNRELPREFRINMHAAFGCLTFFVVLVIINVLLAILLYFD